MSIPTYGVSHGTSHGTSYGPYYGPQYAQSYSPYGYGYQQPVYSPNYGLVAPNSQGTSHYGASITPYTGQTGGGYCGHGHGGYGNQSYVNQNYQGASDRHVQPRFPFLAMLNFPDLLRLERSGIL